LFPALAATRELDPWAAAATAAGETGAAILLKGVPSVVAANQRQLLTIVAGNPGLATGGSGDVLSGLVGSNLAGGLEPDIAAALGAQMLGRAADLAARRHTARGVRPMDVVQALPDLWREWEVLYAARPAPRPPVLFELTRPQTV
jgi:NAD(P)H-hydrate epimerase